MYKLGIIGLGNMGRAILGGIKKAALLKEGEICCFDQNPSVLKGILEEFSVGSSDTAGDLVAGSDVVLIAVKPQNLHELSEDTKGRFRDHQTVISVLAGKKVSQIKAALGDRVNVIRAMPNTPCIIGKGVTGLYASPGVSGEAREFARGIFSALGNAAYFDSEDMIDVVTGFTGSGPAFIFIFIEALSDGAVRCGMPRDLALQFATSLVEGSAALVRETGIHPERLKEMVMSPGGTTAEGVSVLEKGGFRGLAIEAVRQAFLKTKSID
jgi:pyrroline-5-carboxylate reductase